MFEGYAMLSFAITEGGVGVYVEEMFVVFFGVFCLVRITISSRLFD